MLTINRLQGNIMTVETKGGHCGSMAQKGMPCMWTYFQIPF